MFETKCDVAVIGGGPAGLAAAIAAKKQGAQRVLIIERDSSLGGILQQCIHPGFGLSYFKEELTGPEYARRFMEEAEKIGVETLFNTMALEVSPKGRVICVNSRDGITSVKAISIVLAMGCRERTRGNIAIPGTRPAGVYTAGSAQRLLNRQNLMVGREVVILGSGDIGMIMARRMTLEGAKVVAVVELLDYLAGLTRNRVQCLDDFGIPLLLSHTVTGIVGNGRVEGVYVSKVDENKKPIKGTEKLYRCDTLLLSVGLIPENELSKAADIEVSPVTNGPIVNQYMQTSESSVFACGNVVHVNDLADNVSTESEIAGREAARYAMGNLPKSKGKIAVLPGANIRYVCPQHIALDDENRKITVFFRVNAPDLKVKIKAYNNGKLLKSKAVAKVNPGEMESVSLNQAELSSGNVTISVEKEV